MSLTDASPLTAGLQGGEVLDHGLALHGHSLEELELAHAAV